MMKRINKIILTICTVFFLVPFFSKNAYADNTDPIALLYFTGIGCPHCAKTDPVLIKELTQKYDNLYVFEYEIYRESSNAQLLDEYNENLNTGYGIPRAIFDSEKILDGDIKILNYIEQEIKHSQNSSLLFSDGRLIPFKEIDFNSLPKSPKIWHKDQIAIKTAEGNEQSNEDLLKFFTEDDFTSIFDEINFNIIDPQTIQLSGTKVEFKHAAEIKGWILQWNGKSIDHLKDKSGGVINNKNDSPREQKNASLSKTISLGAVDAVNPCALAVLTMMLIAIIAYNPRDRRNILLSGLAFSCAVLIMYMFYGIIIIKAFQFLQDIITGFRLTLYKILAVGAIILSILQIKDYFKYKAGGLGTEMPLFMRPKVKKIIEGITSPRGAFTMGLFVTLFLLPCTIGPYIILSGMLSFVDIVKALPHLIIYNLIFILPMLAITIIVYMGLSKVENISEWKEKNIRTLHLISGVIIGLLGIAMFAGWV